MCRLLGRDNGANTLIAIVALALAPTAIAPTGEFNIVLAMRYIHLCLLGIHFIRRVVGYPIEPYDSGG